MMIVGIAFWFIAILSLFLFVEVVAAWFARNHSNTSSSELPLGSNCRAAILIPAHNEEAVIGQTLESILPQLRDGDEVVVVADNCTDSTKDVVSEYMSEAYKLTVLERIDDNKRGKGYALDHAVNYIKGKRFDVILMVDADCILDADCRDKLAEETLKTNRPVQALYLMTAEKSSATLSLKLSEFAWSIKNKIRPSGLLALGGPCQLMGTGMAFPAGMLDDTELASGCIVEDMKLGLDLAIEGAAPKFLPSTTVWSKFPDSSEVSEGQKSRWVHGHMEMILLYVPKLIKEFIKKRDLNLLLIGFDLLVPPLILLLIINICALLLSLIISFFTGSSIFLVSLASVSMISASIFIAWLQEGRHILSGKELFYGGLAILKKLSLYAQFLTNKRKDWNKTSRK